MTTDGPVLTTRMKLWQLENGRPLREAVKRAIDSEGSIAGAARQLGVSHFTLREWLERLDIQVTTRTRCVEPGDPALSAAS